MWNETFNTLAYCSLKISPYFLHATTIACPCYKIFPEEGLWARHICFVVHWEKPFYLWYTIISFPFYFKYYHVMVTDLPYYTARGERTLGPDKVNIQQCISMGWAIYYLSEPVFPYQTVYRCLSSTITTRVSIPICTG